MMDGADDNPRMRGWLSPRRQVWPASRPLSPGYGQLQGRLSGHTLRRARYAWSVGRDGRRRRLHGMEVSQSLLIAGALLDAWSSALAQADRLPPIIFPGCPERWRRDEALKAEADPPQTTLEQRHQAAGDILAVRCRRFFSTGVLFSVASHIPVETAQ